LGQTLIDEDGLLKGAWYALEQAGILIDDAVTLYDKDDWSTAVGLALLGREELGKSRILRDLAKEATGRSVLVSEVQAACNKHKAKQAKAILSHVFKPPRNSKLGRAIVDQMEGPAWSPKATAARAVIDAEIKAEQDSLPTERHQRRLQAFYLDLQDSGEWVRPVAMDSQEARDLVEHAVNDYALPFHNLNIEGHAPEMTRVRKVLGSSMELRPPRWPKGTA
jgi:AbiV family abortive infection protein